MATVSRELAPVVPVAVPHARVLREAMLLAFMLATAVPFAMRVADVRLAPMATLAALGDQRLFRLLTGSAGLALIGCQFMLPLLRRWGSRHPHARLRVVERLHTLNGAPLLLVVLAHTSGRPGRGVLTWLLTALTAMLLMAQAGQVLKAQLWSRAQPESHPSARDLERNHAANGADGWVHQSGLQLHVSLAVLVLVLTAFHVLSVLYY
jgi:hypothetical protein